MAWYLVVKHEWAGRLLLLCSLVPAVLFTGCGEGGKNFTELATGNWTQLRNRAYILWVTNPKGEWQSSVRIADATSRIVKAKGNAKGMWHIENDQMIVTVMESDIEEVWRKNATIFYDIVALSKDSMQLRDESGRVSTWNRTRANKAGDSEADPTLVLPMGPVVVNLNKNRSHDKDRYLCLNLNLVFKELMPDQTFPVLHPRVKDAAIVFLSSLVFNDVKDFDGIREQGRKLTQALNPYLESALAEVEVEHVIVAGDVAKVEEFIIEHTMRPTPKSDGESESGEDPSQKKQG